MMLSYKEGHIFFNRTEEQKQAVMRVVESLEQAGSVKDIDYTGTTWRTVFSTSTSESAGKLGPFTGRVRQVRSASALQRAGFSHVFCVLTTGMCRSSQQTCPAST